MAHVLQDTATEPAGVSRYVRLKPMLAALLGLFVLFAAARLYQQAFAWYAGTDTTSPLFDKYWLRVFYIETIAALIVAPIVYGWIWVTRDRHLDTLDPHTELRRHFTLVTFLVVYVFAVYFTGSFFAEEDGAWHQVVVRDTALTANHIFLFYLCIPVYLICGIGAYLYAMTRIPQFARGISLAFTAGVAGPFMILPNLGYNEWGHAFWITEEIFSAPIHWGFVVFGWSALGLVGTLVQIVYRMIELFHQVFVAERVKAAV
jgi:methane/ammonia monooxygenase subunit C